MSDHPDVFERVVCADHREGEVVGFYRVGADVNEHEVLVVLDDGTTVRVPVTSLRDAVASRR